MSRELALPYVPIDPRIETHPKTSRFLRAMGSPADPMLHMHLMRFLVSVGEHYPDGNLGKLDDAEIGYMARWQGDAKKFTEALVSSGWLMFGAGGYVVVGWGDYGGQVHAKRVAFREKQSENRRNGWNKKKNQTESETTKPYQNLPNDTKTSEGEGEGEGEGEVKPKPLAPSSKSSALALRPSGFVVPLNTGEEFPVQVPDLEQWQRDFPAIDVAQELRSMRAWCDANPTKRKTARGVKAFVVRWLARSQDRGGGPAEPRLTGKSANVRAAVAAASPDMFKASRGGLPREKKPWHDAEQ